MPRKTEKRSLVPAAVAPHVAALPRDTAGESPESVLLALSRVVENRDRMTGGHCERMAFLCVQLGCALGLSPGELSALHRGGYLHDIGKVGVPDSILYKPTRLDEQEWEQMRTHTVRGEEICRPLHTLVPVLPIIRSHHERWDGTGYPDGLRGNRIPLLARVLQFADIYDALTHERPYKPALPPETALATMQEETDRGWRDPDLMTVFREVHRGLYRVDASLANLSRSLAASERRNTAALAASAD